jgi:hypothetical protein
MMGPPLVIPKTSSLTKQSFFVIRRILEQLADRSGYVGLMISGSMGMTHFDFIAQSFHVICLQVLGPGGKSVPVHVITSFADCREPENLDHFIASYCIVPSVSRVGDNSGNQIFLNIANVSLAMRCEDIDEAACCRHGDTHNWGISHSCHCFTQLRQILIRFMAHTSKLKGKLQVVSSVPCWRKEYSSWDWQLTRRHQPLNEPDPTGLASHPFLSALFPSP